MEKHVESKHFFTKVGHFYFLYLLYFTCTSIFTFWVYIYIIIAHILKEIMIKLDSNTGHIALE